MPSITQYALMCGKLSSISRLIAIVLQVHQAARLRRCATACVLSGWNASGMNVWKPPVSSCKFAQADQVVDAMRGLLDVAVEHGRVGAQAEFVRLAVDAQPLGGVGLVLADLVAHLGVEDLGAAAGQAAEAGVLELGQQVARRPAGQPGEPVPLDRRVRLQVQPRMGLVDDADDVQIPLVGQLVVQPADDVQLGGAAALGLGGALEDLLVAS